jgi:hypothetical protein
MSSFYLRAPQDNLHPTRADLEFETTAWLGRRDSNLCIYIRNLPRLSAEGLGLELAHLESKMVESRTSYKPLRCPIDAYIPSRRDEVQQI